MYENNIKNVTKANTDILIVAIVSFKSWNLNAQDYAHVAELSISIRLSGLFDASYTNTIVNFLTRGYTTSCCAKLIYYFFEMIYESKLQIFYLHWSC